MSDDQQTSQADELTEMWDADSLREAGLDLDSPPSATNTPKTAPAKQDEPSVSVDLEALSQRPPPKKKRKKGLKLSLPVQVALVVLVAVGSFLLVRMLR